MKKISSSPSAAVFGPFYLLMRVYFGLLSNQFYLLLNNIYMELILEKYDYSITV
jgi:hypothetical protein